MPTRISGACNGCRTKKQKCSGDRLGCTQCLAASIQCTWPEQRKRGPAKGYIEGLEHRLHEAESLLLALLPTVSTDQLNCAASTLIDGTSNSVIIPGLKTRDSQSPSPHNMRSSPPVLNKKTGIDYWESFPLDNAENIRRWQEDCAVHSSNTIPQQSHSSFRNSIDDSQSHPHILASLNNASGTHSRTGSIDLSRHSHRHSHSHSHSQSQQAPFRAVSTDSYRSGASTPVHASQHSQPTNTQQRRSPNLPQTTTPNWQSLTLFSPNTNTSSPIANTTSPNSNGVGIGAEALLLQSFADSSWAHVQQGMNAGNMASMGGMGGGNAMSVEPGPMEVDTGFFTNDMQRRLFW